MFQFVMEGGGGVGHWEWALGKSPWQLSLNTVRVLCLPLKRSGTSEVRWFSFSVGECVTRVKKELI